MLNIDNYLEGKFREIGSYKNYEYTDLYRDFSSEKIKIIFSTVHHLFNVNYKRMNERLPTKEYGAHFWAEESRELLFAIEIIRGMQRTLKNTAYDFELVDYYDEVVKKSEKFLSPSCGSDIPSHMDKIELYYTIPIFIKKNSVDLGRIDGEHKYTDLKLIGEGSYAKVFSFNDNFYNRKFVLKRAKTDLNTKELQRFKQEFDQMNVLSSPYIVEVYRFDENKNEYIMEFMDITLDKYIEKNNTSLKKEDRKNIIGQILRAFKYIHSKGLLHRDISPKNILIKEFEDVNVVKIADFGLVKAPNSNLTSFSTEFKGYFNDPGLITEGFVNYGILHETYALTRLIYYVMTGKTNTSVIKENKLSAFVNKGLSTNLADRYHTVDEMINEVKLL